MRVGHILAFIGAIIALLGGAVMDWQTFELAGITVKGMAVAPAGQIALGLAALVAVSSLAGLLTKKRYQFAGVSLVFAVALGVVLIWANVGKYGFYELMPFEKVEMQSGFVLAAWGLALMFLGPLVTLACEPAWDPKSKFLRVALLWKDTVIGERVLTHAQTFTIGEDLGADFTIPNETGALPKKFPLFKAGAKGSYAISLTNEMDGQITVNNNTSSIGEFVKGSGGSNDTTIDMGDWGMVQLEGDMKVFFQFIQPDSRGTRTGLLDFEEGIAATTTTSGFVLAGFIVLAVLLWNVEFLRPVNVEGKRNPDITAEVMTEDEPETPPIEEDAPEEEDVSKKAGGEEGRFGDEDEDPDKKSKIPHLDAKMVDKIDVKRIGLNDLLSTNKLGGSGAISEIMSATSEGMSNKLAVAMGGEGSEFVIGHGAGGMGFSGDGTGGGGTGVGRIQGLGDIDTGGGTGVRAGLGKRKKRRVGKVKVGSGKSTGFCKKSNISSVVRRRAGAIRACYEQRLQVKKGLKGKLTARWTIQLDGKVNGVAKVKDTIGDPATTNCIFRHLRRMRFAKPEGGMCVVQWPFVFSPG